MALKTIFIVEDDLSIRTALKLLFEEEGYPVLLAKHGQEALDLLESSKHKFGLILLDFMMPVMDGPTFLLELKRNHPKILSSIPIFIITAGNNYTHQVTIKTTGLLRKPFDMDELFSVVTRYCGAEITKV